jgi:hypothetical protein
VTPRHKRLRCFSLFHKWAVPACDAAAVLKVIEPLHMPTPASQASNSLLSFAKSDDDIGPPSTRCPSSEPQPGGLGVLGHDVGDTPARSLTGGRPPSAVEMFMSSLLGGLHAPP